MGQRASSIDEQADIVSDGPNELQAMYPFIFSRGQDDLGDGGDSRSDGDGDAHSDDEDDVHGSNGSSDSDADTDSDNDSDDAGPEHNNTNDNRFTNQDRVGVTPRQAPAAAAVATAGPSQNIWQARLAQWELLKSVTVDVIIPAGQFLYRQYKQYRDPAPVIAAHAPGRVQGPRGLQGAVAGQAVDPSPSTTILVNGVRVAAEVQQQAATEASALAPGEKECSICFERSVKTMLLPCKHVHLCIQCTLNLCGQQRPICPQCRADIKEVMRVYC